MSVNDQIIDGDLYADAFHGSGAYLTNISRTGLSLGTPNSVVVNDGAGVMSDQLYLSAALGGTGIDSSALSGVVRVTAGAWGVGGSIVDADISPVANIQRSKLAPGAPNAVVIDNGAGVMTTEAQLAVSRGGTGQDFSAVVGPAVISITAGAMSASLGYAMTATPATLAQRDGAGSLFVVDSVISGSSRANTIAPFSGNTVTFGTGAGPTFTQTTTFKNERVVQFVEAGSAVESFARTGQTIGATTTTLLTFATTLNSVHDIEATISGVNTSGVTATFIWRAKGQNSGGVVTVNLIDQKRQRAAPLATSTTTIGTSGANIIVQATGVALLTIKWTTSVIITTRTA